jgi:peptidoglycan/xylan/chitin deacetylase (PgdA/CDA1 family)
LYGFRRHIKFLVEKYSPISIDEFMKIMDAKIPVDAYKTPPILLGFDDGFRNIIHLALPVLAEYRVPALFFVLGAVLKNPDFVPWFVEITHLLRKTKKSAIFFKNIKLDLTSHQSRTRLSGLIDRSFKACGSEFDRQLFLNQFARLVDVDRPTASELDEDLRLVNVRDLANLGAGSLLTVASHAMTHRHLATLTADEQFYELKESDRILRSYCPSYHPVISYPAGSFNAQTIAISRKIYEAGFAVLIGSSYRNLYAYPRVCIGPDSVEDLRYAIGEAQLKYVRPIKRLLHITGFRPAD